MVIDSEYKQWIIEVKAKIRSAQMKAAFAITSIVVKFYWDLGKIIAEKQTAWGTKFLEQFSKDLMTEFPDMKGLSVRNLKCCRQFYQYYSNEIEQKPDTPFRQQAVAHLSFPI